MSVATAREQSIVQEVGDYARRLRLRLNPAFVIGSAPAAAGAFFGNAVIVISLAMLDLAKFGDTGVRLFLPTKLDMWRDWTPIGSGRAGPIAARQRASSMRIGSPVGWSGARMISRRRNRYVWRSRSTFARESRAGYHPAFCPSVSWSPSASSVGFSSGEIGVN